MRKHSNEKTTLSEFTIYVGFFAPYLWHHLIMQ